MNLQLTTPCYSLTITGNDCCTPATTGSTIHPDNARTLFPHNPRNRYDRFAAIHNEAVLYSYTCCKPDDDLETILNAVDEYIDQVKDVPKLPFTSKSKKPRLEGTSTIQWPAIKDEVLAKEFAELVNKSQRFNPTTDRYEDLYHATTVTEDHVMLRSLPKETEAQLLLITSAIRHCHALWLGIGEEIDPGVVLMGTPITDADIAAANSVPITASDKRRLKVMSRASRKKAREIRRN